jgi:hypothetical protein
LREEGDGIENSGHVLRLANQKKEVSCPSNREKGVITLDNGTPASYLALRTDTVLTTRLLASFVSVAACNDLILCLIIFRRLYVLFNTGYEL